MAITVGAGFRLRSPQQNFERDSYTTLDEMKNVVDSTLPDIFTATCLETGKLYIYKKDNAVDETLGKWREIVGTGGSSELTNPITVSETVGGAEQGTSYPIGTSIEDVIADVLGGESKTLRLYYGSVDDTTSIDIATLTEVTVVSGAELLFTSDNKNIVILYEDTEEPLLSIRDDNGFNYNSEFMLSTQNISGVDYKVYGMPNKTTCTDFIFTIKF